MSIDVTRIDRAHQFFTAKGLAPDEIIRRGKMRGLHPSLIERAMVAVAEIYVPERDRDHLLAWRVWAVAQEIKAKLYQSGKDQYKERVAELALTRYWLRIAIGYGIVTTLAIIALVIRGGAA